MHARERFATTCSICSLGHVVYHIQLFDETESFLRPGGQLWITARKHNARVMCSGSDSPDRTPTTDAPHSTQVPPAGEATLCPTTNLTPHHTHLHHQRAADAVPRRASGASRHRRQLTSRTAQPARRRHVTVRATTHHGRQPREALTGHHRPFIFWPVLSCPQSTRRGCPAADWPPPPRLCP